jgi:Carboxypeptidase regulatory-like domain
VQDSGGRPIAGATVYLTLYGKTVSVPGIGNRLEFSDYPCKTDSRGRWQCNSMPDDIADLWIRLEHGDYLTETRFGESLGATIAGLRDGSAVMVMKKGLPLSGVIRDAHGVPVARAVVALGGTRAGWHFPQATTDAKGRFRFAHVAPGDEVMTVQAKGHAPDLRILIVAPNLPPVEFRLGPPRSFRGRVIDLVGAPIARTSVSVDAWRGYRSLTINTETDSEGRFQVDDLPDEITRQR